tara:strand:- start:404 stop:571 length:168 start_codon:yes stop_codon:yes gene_type:complete
VEELDDKGRIILRRIIEDGLITELRYRYDESGDMFLVDYFEEITPFDEEDIYESK